MNLKLLERTEAPLSTRGKDFRSPGLPRTGGRWWGLPPLEKAWKLLWEDHPSSGQGRIELWDEV